MPRSMQARAVIRIGGSGMSDSDNLRVRIVKLPATLAEAMLYDGLRANDPSFAAVLAQSETVLIIGASASPIGKWPCVERAWRK